MTPHDVDDASSMKPDEVVVTQLDDEDLARVDALAAARGVSRDEMLVLLVRVGHLAYEETLPPSRRRLKIAGR